MTDRIERYCEIMHDAYEKAAVGAGWETQQASRKPWAGVPEANKETMRAAVGALLAALDSELAQGVEYPPDTPLSDIPIVWGHSWREGLVDYLAAVKANS